MTDNELLEFAAKAAKFTLKWSVSGSHCWRVDGQGNEYLWNPRTDDGDALRLAAKLGMVVDARYGNRQPHSNRSVSILYWLPDIPSQGILVTENASGEYCAATRLAIVRASAEIGKELK